MFQAEIVPEAKVTACKRQVCCSNNLSNNQSHCRIQGHRGLQPTLMLMRSVMRGMKIISSPSQLCFEFASIFPFNFHRCRPYLMKICQTRHINTRATFTEFYSYVVSAVKRVSVFGLSKSHQVGRVRTVRRENVARRTVIMDVLDVLGRTAGNYNSPLVIR